ncbi:hypothetical protein OU995_20370 [Roseateles sp. SL47]|jgi:hypothetical protein|uniref:hypothetical protein n=1 Tax=Roseateles sp. SL47 TaxID=2995138 RepID=UPI002270867F|nr:hypothetical protein [Roseateles sp. SL47]WAC71913.1 hypothetical protein OU995_20370 [Roseateles sp. SL47]
MKQIIILIPHGVQTGGPEALHQLSDALIRQGHDARVWYVLPSDLPAIDQLHRGNGLGPDTALRLQPRPNTVADYEKYQVRLAEQIVMNADTCVVLAETYVHWLRYFQPCTPMVWWLSIDNAFEYLAVQKINLNALRSERVLHTYQSGYAHQVIRALGCHRTLPLSDYTPGAVVSDGLPKTDIALNANHKVLFDVAAIAARLERENGCKVHLIRGMSRAQVYEALGRSRLFIDLGNFPGKDRLAREALMRDCCVFALDVGASRDYALPEECYFKPDQVDQVFAGAQQLMQQYELYLQLSLPARQAVLRERMVFEREVAGLAHAFGC